MRRTEENWKMDAGGCVWEMDDERIAGLFKMNF